MVWHAVNAILAGPEAHPELSTAAVLERLTTEKATLLQQYVTQGRLCLLMRVHPLLHAISTWVCHAQRCISLIHFRWIDCLQGQQSVSLQ